MSWTYDPPQAGAFGCMNLKFNMNGTAMPPWAYVKIFINNDVDEDTSLKELFT